MCKDTIRNEPNRVRFSRVRAQTMSFVERGLERLGLGHQMVSFPGVYTRLSVLYPWSPSPGGGLGGSGSWPFFPAF